MRITTDKLFELMVALLLKKNGYRVGVPILLPFKKNGYIERRTR